jgi:hypothetical protein
VLDIAALKTLDPDGIPPTEKDEFLINLTDDDPVESRWRTDRYEDPNFGNLKDGLGIVVDMGQTVQLSAVTLTTPSPGISYELRVADEASNDPDAWEKVTTVENATEEGNIQLGDRQIRTRYLLIWIVPPLVQYDGGWTAAFSDLKIEGVPS